LAKAHVVVEYRYSVETNVKEYICYFPSQDLEHMPSTVSAESLARKQLERRLAPLRKAPEFARPSRGWVRAVRDALGMTAAQLGGRIGVSQSRIARIERDEAEDAVTLATLRRVAEGLDCTLVYALVPNEPLEEVLKARARARADAQLRRTHHSMRLENQALDTRDLEAERERLAGEILAGDPRRLWDSP
jgi:predicted DNA-binding mobile mystery protein A